MIALRRLLFAVRWHWWTDETTIPEVSLLLRSLGWLAQVARMNPAAFRSDVFVRVLAISSQAFWLALLTAVLALVVVSYVSGRLPPRIAGALAYIFWWAFVSYILARIGNTSTSLPDAIIDGAIAFWLLIRLSRRAGIRHAQAVDGQP